MVAFFLYKNTLCNVCKIKMQEQEITSDEIYENSSIVDFTITGYKNDENHFILQRNCLYLQKSRNALCWQTRLLATISTRHSFFDKLYVKMNEAEKREFLSQLVDNVQIYEERKESGPWLKTIEFKLLIIKKFTLSLENDTQNENILLLSK